MSALYKMVGHGIKFLACGKVNSGFYFKNRRDYASLTSGLISIFGLIFLFVMIVLALDDCFKKRYMLSDVEQGMFSYENLQEVDVFLKRINMSVEITTTIKDFCNEQEASSYLIKGQSYFNVEVDCLPVANTETHYLYRIKFSDT